MCLAPKFRTLTRCTNCGRDIKYLSNNRTLWQNMHFNRDNISIFKKKAKKIKTFTLHCKDHLSLMGDFPPLAWFSYDVMLLYDGGVQTKPRNLVYGVKTALFCCVCKRERERWERGRTVLIFKNWIQWGKWRPFLCDFPVWNVFGPAFVALIPARQLRLH